MNRFIFYIIFICLSFQDLSAQTPTIQDCLGAIPICQQIYTEDQSPIGIGNYDEIHGNGTCTSSETNSIWYTFTVNQTGNFGFVITPNNSSDDYDWWMFDITNTGCAGINSNPVTSSCNVAGGDVFFGPDCDGPTGANGDSNYSMQGAGCGNNPPDADLGLSPFNDLIPVQAGNTYVLCVSNWTGSTFGYSIDFGLSGDIGILDEIIPEVSEVITPDACDDSLIEVIFSEYIQCPTIDAANFQLSGPGGPYSVSLNSDNCNAGGEYDRNFSLTISPSIQSLGDFTLTMNTDGSSEVLDLCGNPANSNSFTFTVTESFGSIPVDLGAATANICEGDTLFLDATFEDDNAIYEWQDGFSGAIYPVLAAGSYSVTVSNSCRTGMDEMTVSLSTATLQVELGDDATLCDGETILLDATNDSATYEWQDGSSNPTFEVTETGTYSVTVTNECGSTSDNIVFTYLDDFILDLGADQELCEGETLLLTTNVSGVDILWQDGSSNPTFEVTEAGIYSVTLSTSCLSITDSIQVSYFDQVPVITFSGDTTLCDGETILLDATNPDATYEWQDGSTLPTFEISESGTYSVTVTNACDVATESVSVLYVNDFSLNLGADQALCEGETIMLNTNASGIAVLWQDGSSQPTFMVEEAGIYSVTLSTSCMSFTDSIEITYVSNPQVDLGEDIALCPDESVLLDASFSGATYEWQDGSTAATFEVIETGQYAVTVSNACGDVIGRQTTTFTPPIEIDLGADTVLCPGESFVLDAFAESAIEYVWNDNSSKSQNIVFGPGLYTVQALNECESVMEEIFIRECEKCVTYFPNAFSPNNDGVNDTFKPFSSCDLEAYHLQVFDRWGSLVFESFDEHEGWDGWTQDKLAANGVYIWMMDFVVMEDFEARSIEEKGDVLLIR